MENFRFNPPTRLDENSGVIGLDTYLKSLEKHYFADVSLRSYHKNTGAIEMTIDMKCNLNLLELLGFHNKARWGNNGTDISPLKRSFDVLIQQNRLQIDIEELTIFLNDTCIVIKKIYNQSISEQLNTILSEVANHYVYFSKGLTEKPYEIFIPVFEDSLTENGLDGKILSPQERAPQNYFEFWGVYLESEEDALIYNLDRTAYISADLELCMID